MVKTVSLNLEVGQIVWFQSSEVFVISESVKVMEVGRLWAKLSNGYKCNRYTGFVDGGRYVSPGTVYATREDYDKAMRLLATWRRLQKDVAKKQILREDITRRQILAVRRILRLDE